MKYIDLLSDIKLSIHHNSADEVAVFKALEWLDYHPSRTPGRTITETELERTSMAAWGYRPRESDRGFLKCLGIKVVPDPEPTNAEKWEKFCKQSGVLLTPWQIDYMVAAMEEYGVEAPEVRS